MLPILFGYPLVIGYLLFLLVVCHGSRIIQDENVITKSVLLPSSAWGLTLKLFHSFIVVIAPRSHCNRHFRRSFQLVRDALGLGSC